MAARSDVRPVDRLGRENQVLRELVATYHQLTGLTLQSADLDSVVELLAERLTTLVAVVSPTLAVMSAAARGLSRREAADVAQRLLGGSRLARVIGSGAPTRRALRLPAPDGRSELVLAPVVVADEVRAHLVAAHSGDEEPDADITLLVCEHAATICGVVLGREAVVAAAAGRIRQDLLEGLLYGRAVDSAEAERWAAYLGYDAQRQHRVIVLAAGADLSAERLGHLLENLGRFVAGQAPTGVVAAREKELVVIAREADSPRELAEACVAHSHRLFPRCEMTAGVSGAVREPRELAAAYAQATRTITALRRLGRGGRAVGFEELGLYRLLLQVPDLDELRAFADDVLGRLAEHERRHPTGLMRTLATYLRANGSLQRAAHELHVHPNTVTYRVGRAEEITGLDFNEYRDRLLAQVALEIMDALEGTG